MEPKHLNLQQQIDLLIDRGMIVSNKQMAISKLENIGYYKLKEFAFPISTVSKNENDEMIIRYDGVKFDSVITRYYQDKNLRLGLLHAIEKIEVSLKTKISFVLGEAYGAFGYLNFSNWCNRNEYCKHYLRDQENKFKRELIKKTKLSHSPELFNKQNFTKNDMPSIWLMTDVLMFGDIINLLKLMSKKNIQRIANFYNCSDSELISWLKCVNFVRNICAHNSNILDIKLKTAPKIHVNWKQDIYQFDDGNYSNRLAIVIFIIHYFISHINNKYHFSKISKAIEKIVGNDEQLIQQLGFTNKKAIEKLKKF